MIFGSLNDMKIRTPLASEEPTLQQNVLESPLDEACDVEVTFNADTLSKLRTQHKCRPLKS